MSAAVVGGKGDGPDYRRIAGMDPAANWLLGVNRAEFYPEGEKERSSAVPFLLELEDEAAVAAFNALPPLDHGFAGGNGALFLRTRREAPPEAERDTGSEGKAEDGSADGEKDDGRPRVEPGRPIALAAKPVWFDRLVEPGDEKLEAFRRANKRIEITTTLPLGADAGWSRERQDFGVVDLPAPPDGLMLPPGAVVMAVIDDGIAFAHRRFRNAAGGSRVYSHWSMHPLPGRHVFKPEIDAALAAGLPGGEDAIYRRLGIVDYRDPVIKTIDRRISHGTHVLDLAAGYEPGEAPERPIISVSLPPSVLAEPYGRFLEPTAVLAVDYVLARVEQLSAGGPPHPVVFCISLGTIAGPHDGSLLFERHITRILSECRPYRQVVLPAGNAQSARCHASVPLDRAGATEIPWQMLPDGRTESHLQIWLPAQHDRQPRDGRLEVTLVAPGGAAVTQAERLDAPKTLVDGAGRPFGLVQFSLTPGPAPRGRVDIWIAPTARDQPSPFPVAPAGRWTLGLRVGAAEAGEAHVWVQRNDSLFGYPLRGRQSYLDHPGYRRFDARGFALADDPPGQAGPVRRRSLLNALASGPDCLVAGSYALRSGEAAPYAAGGPATPPEGAGRRKPDALMPGDASRALRGMLAAGSRSGSTVGISGTSVAAPQLARRAADLLADKQIADRATVRAEAEAADPPPTALPPERGGWGRLPPLPRGSRQADRDAPS